MADERKRRHNLLSGTLGAELASGATNITFAAALQEYGSDIATLAADEHLVLVIESEVVYLTAYTSGATTGTVVRGKEGSTDATHANGTALKSAPTKTDFWAPAYTTVATSEGTTTTTFTDLATAGPAVTVTIGQSGAALVTLTANIDGTGSNIRTYMGFAVSGASTVAAADTAANMQQHDSANTNTQQSWTGIVTGLTAGSNTFTAKYRTSGGTGTWANRHIIVEPIT